VFEHCQVTAAFDLARHQSTPAENSGKSMPKPSASCETEPTAWTESDEPGESPIQFDDTDGAYAVGEPDPFADSTSSSAVRRAEARTRAATPSLRSELTGALARPMAALARPALPSLSVLPQLAPVLPDGLRRGSTIAVTSSVSLLLALLGAPSAAGAWAAMVGMPSISADAAAEAGIDLGRLAIISPPDGGWTAASWTTAVGALLDAVDIVVARPGGVSGGSVPSGGVSSGGVGDGDARRLTARARNKDAVLVLFGQQATSWPSVEVQLSAQHVHWNGISDGHGRITARQLVVSATGRGRSARPRTTDLWLPATGSPPTGTDISTDLLTRAG
jgi:hypothetical protein